MSTTSAQRIRENQRRSRARRRQHTQQLEERLRTLEREGVQVTVQIQSAARKVARENALLRSFLAYRGIPHSEFVEYARNQKEENSSDVRDIELDSRVTISNSTAQVLREVKRDSSVHNTPLTSTERKHSSIRSPAVQDTESQPPKQLSFATVKISGDKATEGTCNNMASSPLETTNSPSSQIRPQDSHQMTDPKGTHDSVRREDVTSCVIAAGIIAGMRGRPDIDEVKAELGCAATQNCMISNIQVFRAMDT